ncbi:MAG: winged helix-turn-helix domain-containing protein [Acetobacteraceae bacterium]
MILSGAAAPGSRLPATRLLAAKLGMSRTSVVGVYEQLLAEGYAEGRAGAGTFVSRDMLEPPLGPKTTSADPSPPAKRPTPAAALYKPETGRCPVRGRSLQYRPAAPWTSGRSRSGAG